MGTPAGNWLRIATPEQASFYEDFLYPWQDEVLAYVQSDALYLTGGTCLSRFGLNHRYSDDLDFFFEGWRLDSQAFELEYRHFLQQLAKKFPIEPAVDSEYFKRLFLVRDNFKLKIECINEPTPVIGERIVRGNLRLDTHENIAANKITAVFGRKTTKDYVDLYYLLQEFPLEQVLNWASGKMLLPDYEGTVMSLFGEPFVPDALLKTAIDPTEFDHFVENLNTALLQHARTLS